jgi:predicted RNase H-like nuclease (RuvC/YqgF family)
MRKPIVIALALVSVLLLGATVLSYSKYRKSMAQYAEATAAEQATRIRYGEAINEIVGIQDSLNTIVMGEEAAQAIPAQHPQEVEGAGTLHDQVLARISELKSSIERTKTRIEDLDARLKRSGVKVRGLERMVSSLKKSVAEREARVAALTTQVDTLQTQVAGLNGQVATQQVQIADTQAQLTDTQHQMATVFLAMGTKKQLMESGVIESKGGVLGLGKTLEATGHFDESASTVIDTDEQSVIEIPSDKAQVLSAQPVGSYVLTPTGKDSMELRIRDPEAFRKVKHIVIVTS